MKPFVPTSIEVASKLTRIVVGLLVAAVLAPMAACEDVTKTAEEERRIAAEQAVIQRYSERVPDVDAKLKTFLAAWERANDKKDIKSLKDDLSANVLPAFQAHVGALEAMPTGSAALAAIHAPLVASYRAAQEAFDVFLREVTEDNLEAAYARLLSAMDSVKAAEDTYFDALAAHYAASRMTFKQAP